MFVVFTLVSCWIGYNVNWIGQRHAAMENVRSSSGCFYLAQGRIPPPHPFPTALRLLGEKPVRVLLLGAGADSSQADSFHALFPEAAVHWAGHIDWKAEEKQ
jgi:hypothetical protein